MKKTVRFFLILILSCFLLYSCSDGGGDSNKQDNPTATNTSINTVTETSTSTTTDTNTNTNTNTDTDTISNTDTNTNTSTSTSTKTDTNTSANTNTGTSTETLTNTGTNTNTNTETNTATDTETDVLISGAYLIKITQSGVAVNEDIFNITSSAANKLLFETKDGETQELAKQGDSYIFSETKNYDSEVQTTTITIVPTSTSSFTGTMISEVKISGDVWTEKLELSGSIISQTTSIKIKEISGAWANSSGYQSWQDSSNPRYSFEVKEEKLVVIYLKSKIDNMLYLLDSNDNIIESNDDDNSDNNYSDISIIMRVLPPGKYMVAAVAYDVGIYGNFLIEIFEF
ncbi:MAG: hypothetical protein HQK76_02170 [Desulfobacterales bacterium]|nr:hypothetical protein [Desulfobacterales bacterium]